MSDHERDTTVLIEGTRIAINVRSVMLTGIFVLLLLFALDYASKILIPVVLAFLLSLLLAPVGRALARTGLPAPAAAALVMVTLLAGTGAAIAALSGPAERWFSRLPWELQRIEYKLRRIKQPLEEIKRTSEKVEEVANLGDTKTATVEFEPRTFTDLLLSATPALLGGIGMVVVLTFYLLATGDQFLRKLVRAIPRFSDKKRAVAVIRLIQQRISRYLLVTSVINLGLAVVTGLVLWALGVPNAPLWGAMVGVLNYAPYLGAAVSTLVLAVVGLLTFEPLWQALSVPAAYFALTVLEGQFLTPAILGRGLALNPLAVLLSLIGWAWLWGIPGALMAVPLLACFKVVCEHVEPLRGLALFLGPGGRPPPASEVLPLAEAGDRAAPARMTRAERR